jgi:hypothetical protein
LRWAGHVIRRENEEIIKRIMLVKPEGKRKKGGPRMRWMDGVEKDLRNLVCLTGKQRHKNEMGGESFYSRPRPTKGWSANNNNNKIYNLK